MSEPLQLQARDGVPLAAERGTSDRGVSNPIAGPSSKVDFERDRGSTGPGRSAKKTPTTQLSRESKDGSLSGVVGRSQPVSMKAGQVVTRGPSSPNAATLPSKQLKPTFQNDNALRTKAERIADLHYLSERNFVDETVLARVALSRLEETPVLRTEAEFRRVLKFLSFHRDAYEHLFRLTREPKLGEYFANHGVSWEEMFLHDQPTAIDWAEFSAGAAGGAAAGFLENDLQLLLLPVDIVRGIYVAVGRFWSPKLAKTYDQFTTALGELIRHPIVAARTAWQAQLAEVQMALQKRRYGHAGFLLGKIAPNILFSITSIKGLAQFGVKVARALPRLTLNAIRNLKLTKEFARFYYTTNTRQVLANGSRLERFENSIVLIDENGKGARLDLAALTPEEATELKQSLVGPKEPVTGPTHTPIPTPTEPRSSSPPTPPSPRGTGGRLVNGVPATRSRSDKAINHSLATKGNSDRGILPETPKPQSPIEEALEQARADVYKAAKADAQYKADRKAQGLSQKGGAGHKNLANARERQALYKRLLERSELDALEEVRPQAFILPDGTEKAYSELKLPDRRWDWIESGDGAHWKLVEKKTESEILKSVEGGLSKGPIAGQFKTRTPIGRELGSERAIYGAASTEGPKLRVTGKNPRTGLRETRIVDLDKSSTSLSSYDGGIDN